MLPTAALPGHSLRPRPLVPGPALGLRSRGQPAGHCSPTVSHSDGHRVYPGADPRAGVGNEAELALVLAEVVVRLAVRRLEVDELGERPADVHAEPGHGRDDGGVCGVRGGGPVGRRGRGGRGHPVMGLLRSALALRHVLGWHAL